MAYWILPECDGGACHYKLNRSPHMEVRLNGETRRARDMPVHQMPLVVRVARSYSGSEVLRLSPTRRALLADRGSEHVSSRRSRPSVHKRIVRLTNRIEIRV